MKEEKGKMFIEEFLRSSWFKDNIDIEDIMMFSTIPVGFALIVVVCIMING